MMQVFRFVMCDFFKYRHHQLELILRHNDGEDDLGFLAFRFGTTLRSIRSDSTLGTSAFAACFLVVLIQPLFVVLIHVVRKVAAECVVDRFLNSTRPSKVSRGVLPLPGGIELIIVVNNPRRVGCGDECSRPLVTGSPGVTLGSCRQDCLEMVFLKRK